MAAGLRRKTVAAMRAHAETRTLAKTLAWPHLIGLGIGAVVGSGIYVLIGTTAAMAGPAVLLSFIIAGLVCACAAFAYAELSTLIPVSGGAYTYVYGACGEILAWLVSWSMILGFLLSACFVAVGWSSYTAPYIAGGLEHFGIHVPFALLNSYGAVSPAGEEGFVNLPGVIIILLVMALLLKGTQTSVVINSVLVVVKLSALVLFVIIAMPHFQSGNLTPFMPFGFTSAHGADGLEHGVMAAAAAVFLAFYGFDAVATAVEETKNPGRNLPIGLIGSMMAVLAIFILVCLAALGAMHYTQFADKGDVLSYILRQLGSGWAAVLVAAAAFVALPTVILAMFFAFTRLLFVLGRDGLMPPALCRVSAGGVPVGSTVIAGIIAAFITGFLPFSQIVNYVSAGTLFFYGLVGISLLILRRTEKNTPRAFKTPLVWPVGLITALGCFYLFWNLPAKTQLGFLVWNIAGLAFYFAYGRRKSLMAQK